MPQTLTVPLGALKMVAEPDLSVPLDQLQVDGPTFRQEVVGELPKSTGIGATVGGMVGGLAGGIPGAALGGAAGGGLEALVRNAKELTGAIVDVGRGLVEQPLATLKGFGQGAVQGAGQAAINAGVQGGMQGVGQAIGAVAAPAVQKVAGGLMQSALKPGIRGTLAAMKRGVPIPPVVQTLLNEGVNVTPGGIEKLNGIIGATNKDITAAIDSLSGVEIQPLKVASRLSDVAKRAASQVNPEGDLQAVSQAGQEFLNHPALDATGALSPQQAQALKTGTYAALKDQAYGTVKPAAIEAQKALARGLKEELAAEAAKAGTDLSALNAREGAAIVSRDAVAKRVAMVGNRDPAGLAWLAHNPVTFLAAIMERSPAVKSMLARGLYQSAEKASGISANILRGVVSAVAASQDETPQP